MIIKSMHIISFGGLKNRDVELSPGVNVLCGANESGKTSAAMFIKFIFYGLSSKSTKSAPSERQRYVNRDTMQAAGFIIAETEEHQLYRLERALILSDNAPSREKIRIINQSTGETITGQNPGDYFFGVPEEVFVSTSFVSQSAAMKPDISRLDGVMNYSSSGGAVENLLTSASEDIDVKRGMKKLDTLRRELCHKNGSGGEINELKEKRAALAKELKSTESRAAEIISVGASLDDIKKRAAELEATRERYAELFTALDKIVLKRRIDSMEQTRERLGEISKQLEGISSSPLSPECEESISSAERDIRAYDELVIAYSDGYSGFEESGFTPESDFNPESDFDASSGGAEYENYESGELNSELSEPDVLTDEAHEDLDEANRLFNDSRTKMAVSIALMIAGIIGLGAFAVLYFFNTDLYSIPLIITLALVIVGVVFISRCIKAKSKLGEILDKWDAESIDELEVAMSDRLASVRAKVKAETERDKNLDAAKIRFNTAEAYVNSLAESAGIQRSDSIYETITSLRAIIADAKKRREELNSLSEKLKGRLDALSELVENVDPVSAQAEAEKVLSTDIGQAALSLTPSELKEAVRERDFTKSALKSALKRKTALEEKMLELGRLSHTPDEYRSMINSLDEKIEELSLRHEACELAMKVIGEAGESMRSGIITRLADSASGLMRSCTPHEKVALDSALTPSLTSRDKILPSEIMSRGTADLTYISLRSALCGEVYESERPLTVLDESFAHVDLSRTRNFMRALSDGQYLILTCREDEAEAAVSLGMNVVRL